MCLGGAGTMMAAPVASVQVGSGPIVDYTDFDDAWAAAMNAQEATVTLLADITRTDSIKYSPKVANGRHTLDLNNHTITENTSNRLLFIDKADAHLTITDNSTAKGGCLYKKQSSDKDNIYAVSVAKGEVIMAGGTLYCENTTDDSGWHPAYAICSQLNPDARITVTGGTMEAVATCTAYGICAFCPAHVSGGLVKATTNKYTTARAYSQVVDNGTISGGTFEARAVGGTANTCYAVVAEGYIDTLSGATYNAELAITGGTFFTESELHTIQTVIAGASVRRVNDVIVSAHGTITISGGDFTARCAVPTAKQVYIGAANSARLFDNATPHHILVEEKGELNINGGNFLVDTRDAGGNLQANDGNVDMLRNWGILNVTGGTFTIYQNQLAAGISNYRNKATVSGDPVFYIYCNQYARGINVASWNSDNYSDADATKNVAEVEVSGGTFHVRSYDINAVCILAGGAISSGGYAMSSKVIIHDGEFHSYAPSGKGSYMFQKGDTKAGAYGAALRDISVRGGRFMPHLGSGYGTNIVWEEDEMTELSGGYFPTFKELALHASYDCTLREVESGTAEYDEGYRYQVVPGPTVATVTIGGSVHNFSMLQGAIRYARRQVVPATVKPLTDVPFYGPHRLRSIVANNHIILDLDNHAVNAVTSTDRFLLIDIPDMHFTITDGSAEKGGIFNMNATYGNTIYGLLAYRGEVIMHGGSLRIANATAGKNAIAFAALTDATESAKVTIEGGTMTAPCGILSNAKSYTSITGGKCHFNTNIYNPVGGTIEITGGYYLNDGTNTTGVHLEDYCKCPYDVEPTTADDKAAVGSEYQFKVTDAYDSYGSYLDIVDYTPTSVTLNLNGYTSSEAPKTEWTVRANCKTYAKANRDPKTRTLTLDFSGSGIAPDDELRIVARSKTGLRESHRTYKMPYVFESDATLPAGDYSSSILYVRAGRLTINHDAVADKVIVCPGAEVQVASGTLTANSLVLRTDAWHSAAISGSFVAGNIRYTRIGPDGSDDYKATHFYPFGLPYACPLSDVRLSTSATPVYEDTWALKYYDEAERAVSGEADEFNGLHWKAVVPSGTIGAGVGYELFSSLSYYREYYFPVTRTSVKTVPVSRTNDDYLHSGWNFVCSPLMSIYHNGSDPVTGLKVSWPQPDGSYAQEWPEYIWPAMTFACQVPEEGVLDFSTSNLHITAPRRYAGEQTQTEWIHLDIQDADERGDQTSLFVHPARFADTYETGIDVAKQSFSASRALLYTELPYGAMAFAGVTDETLRQGVPLTVFSPAEQELTISVRDNGWLGRMEHVWLIDHTAGTRTDLLESDYVFAADAGTTAHRFTIEGAFKAQETIESFENGQANEQDRTPRKLLVDGKLMIQVGGVLYDAAGKRTGEQ